MNTQPANQTSVKSPIRCDSQCRLASQWWHTGYTGNCPSWSLQKLFLITKIDLQSKYKADFPMDKLFALTIICGQEDSFIPLHGIPINITSVQGSYFHNKKMSQLANII